MTPPARAAADVEPPSEDELMARVQTGSVDAFETLYDRYGERAYRLARSVCRDDGGAQEAVQQAFVALWRRRATYRSQSGTVAAWLLTAVRDQAIDVDRRNNGTAPDEPDSTMAESDGGRPLRSLLTKLPAPQQEVVALAYYGGLTHTEIATQLGLPPGIVKGRMRLGLRELREHIDASRDRHGPRGVSC